jgi:hypothetical protein
MIKIDIEAISKMDLLECQQTTVFLLHRIIERLDAIEEKYLRQSVPSKPQTPDAE